MKRVITVRQLTKCERDIINQTLSVECRSIVMQDSMHRLVKLANPISNRGLQTLILVLCVRCLLKENSLWFFFYSASTVSQPDGIPFLPVSQNVASDALMNFPEEDTPSVQLEVAFVAVVVARHSI